MTQKIDFEPSNMLLIVVLIASLVGNAILGGVMYHSIDKFGYGSQYERTERVWYLMHNYTQFTYLSNENYQISSDQTFQQMLTVCHNHDKHCKFAIDLGTQYICDGGGPLLDFLD